MDIVLVPYSCAMMMIVIQIHLVGRITSMTDVRYSTSKTVAKFAKGTYLIWQV